MCKIICVTALDLIKDAPFDRIERICRGGIDRLILREKHLSETEYEELAKRVMNICSKYSTELSLHSFPHAARRLCCDTLHMSYADFLKGMGQGFAHTGVSVHSPEEAQECSAGGVSYLTAGHIFATDCKKGLSPRGTDFLAKVCKCADVPVYAIGGISPVNISECICAGAAGVCVMSALMTAPDPEGYIDELRKNAVPLR